MIINDDKKCIFIAVPRCASGTIRGPFNQPRAKWFKGPTHGTAKEARDRYAAGKFNTYFKFAFVRNPWDRMVSWYYWRKIESPFKQWLMEEPLYLRWKHTPIQKLQCSYFICDGNRVLVDFVGRYENLVDDYQHICDVVNISVVPLQHRHATVHKPYLDMYDDESREYVAEMHKKDIALFNYTFEGIEKDENS